MIGMSALLTTTMVYMRTVVQKFKDADLATSGSVSGAPRHEPDYANGDRRRRLRRRRGQRGGALPATHRRAGVTPRRDAAVPGVRQLKGADDRRRAARSGETLFDCAERAGVPVPTSCLKQGKCRECLVEVETGAELLSAPAPQERHLRGRFRLACRTTLVEAPRVRCAATPCDAARFASRPRRRLWRRGCGRSIRP